MLPKAVNFLKLLLITLPPLFIAILVFRNGVDVPFFDQWDGTAALFEKVAAGTLGFGDFFAPHNEHRILFPRLIAFGLARLTHWNTRAELFVIWFLALICLFNIWQLTRHSRRKDCSFWLLFAASVFLFSPLNVQNFLWGFQIGFLLPLACVTACSWVATYVRHPFNFVYAIVLCTICTFSIASGLTSWLLVTPLLALAQMRPNSPSSRKWWSIWACAFLFEVCAYFYRYQKPSHDPPLWASVRYPLSAVEYILAFLGSPFTFGTSLAPLPPAVRMGGVLALLLLICVLYIWRKRSDRDLVGDTLPWLMLAMVAVTTALLAMMGRIHLGSNQARVSRYITYAVLLPIALLALIPIVRSHWTNSFSRRGQLMATSLSFLLLIPFILLAGASFLASLPIWPEIRQTRLYGKALVSFINVAPEREELAKNLFPYRGRVATVANILTSIGYLHPPLLRSDLVREVADPASLGSARFGEFHVTENRSGQIEVGGRAVLPDKGGPAGAVLITSD